ncbi:unnamed protein product [Phytophthora lilii]|uniref:Unnamed protein product n=1 Tax=Phytophthora lilii TaxID=2077276 RepID=A0A9W6U2U0_9STRA|nr:unnamed protein product [Phytophthora lilii]
MQNSRESSSILDLMNVVQSDWTARQTAMGTCSGDQPRTATQEQSEESDAPEPPKKKRVYKKRKATHTLRKEEKQALQMEIQTLQANLEALKLQALMQEGGKDTKLSKKVAHNAVLRDVVQEQYLVLAHTQGMMLGCAQRHSYDVRPTEMFIHLAADRTARHDTLKALKGPKLYYARRFIHQRSMGMHPTAEYFNEERYETPEGDFCNVRFDRIPLGGVRGGIRAVLNALKRAAFNAEIIISETSGNLTIREDDDLTEEDFSQMRLVTQTNRGILVENNLVHFFDFPHSSGKENYAVITADFVDEDERFPYRPHERVRRDATTVILVTSHVEPKDKKETDEDRYGGHTSSEDEGENVVVITRWTFTRICHTELDVPTQVLRELRDLSGRVAETIMNCVRETIGLLK